MDVGSGLDDPCFFGAGAARTLQHLSSLDEPWARDARQYLVSCHDAGDFDDLEGWEQARKAYFANDA